jgi:serine/threonine protein kinase
MVYDMQEKKDVALKILTSGRDGDREIFAQNEIIRRAHDRSNLVIYHSTFQLRGPNNDLHGVLVLPLIGPNLQSTLYKIPLSSHMHVRMSAARQLLLALKSLHDAGIVHSGESKPLLFSFKRSC